MIIPDEQREAVHDVLIDAIRHPKYIVYTNDIMSRIELAPLRSPDMSALPTDEVFSKQYYGREHKKDALIMCAVMNADAIVQALEAIA